MIGGSKWPIICINETLQKYFSRLQGLPLNYCEGMSSKFKWAIFHAYVDPSFTWRNKRFYLVHLILVTFCQKSCQIMREIVFNFVREEKRWKRICLINFKNLIKQYKHRRELLYSVHITYIVQRSIMLSEVAIQYTLCTFDFMIIYGMDFM